MKPTFDLSKLTHTTALLSDADLQNLSSHDTPTGFQTVPGWWAEMWAVELEIMDEDARLSAFFNGTEKLQTTCEERHWPFEWVTAPEPPTDEKH